MAYTRVQGYPQLNINRDGKGGTDKVKSVWADILAIEGAYPIGSGCPFAPDLSLASINVEPEKGLSWGYATLNYLPTDVTIIVDSNASEITADSQGSHEPIESHPDFKMRWSYRLIKKKGKPDYAGTEDVANLIPNDTTQFSKWINPDDQVPDGWVTQLDGQGLPIGPDKWGKTNYVIPYPIIHETKYFSNQKKAGTALVDVGKIKAPKNAFGLDKTKFLLIGVGITREGKKWLVRYDYQFTPQGWDTDIYDNA